MRHINFNSLQKKSSINCPCCDLAAAVVIDLPNYPLTEFFKEIDVPSSPYGFVDQQVMFCGDCNHLFLRNMLDAKQIYVNYLTSTISSHGAVVCLENFVRFIEDSAGDLASLSIIDIGGNDSTFLEYFLGRVNNLINIDANATTKNTAIQIRKSFLEDVDFSEFDSDSPKIFASSHTIEHLEQPVSFIENLSKAIGGNDLLYLQFPSIEMLIKQRRFDQICHQHLNYFSLTSISRVLKSFGLFINAFEYDTAHFGTLRLKISRTQSDEVKQNKLSEINVTDAYSYFKYYYSALNSMLSTTFLNGQGFGAALMLPTLAYHLPLINQLSKIIDENPARLNKRFINLVPPIHSISELDISQPVLITAISTKEASRAIFAKLIGMGVRDICIPATVI